MTTRHPRAPVLITINNGSEYTNSVETLLSFKAKDTGSGLQNLSISTDNENWSSWVPFMENRSFSLTGDDGEKIIYLKVSDKAGNIAEPVMNSILMDTTPPEQLNIVINNGAEYANSNTVILKLEGTDLGSGISNMSFSTDNVIWTLDESFAAEKLFTISSGDGNRTIYFRVKDKAENTGKEMDTIILDTESPYSLNISIKSKDLDVDPPRIVINLRALDNGSGVSQMSFRIDSNEWTQWEDYIQTKELTISDLKEENMIHFRVKDYADNIAIPISLKFLANTTGPNGDGNGDGDGDGDGTNGEKEKEDEPFLSSFMIMMIILIVIVIIVILGLLMFFRKSKKPPVEEAIPESQIEIESPEEFTSLPGTEYPEHPEPPEPGSEEATKEMEGIGEISVPPQHIVTAPPDEMSMPTNITNTN